MRLTPASLLPPPPPPTPSTPQGDGSVADVLCCPVLCCAVLCCAVLWCGMVVYRCVILPYLFRTQATTVKEGSGFVPHVPPNCHFSPSSFPATFYTCPLNLPPPPHTHTHHYRSRRVVTTASSPHQRISRLVCLSTHTTTIAWPWRSAWQLVGMSP